MKLFNASKFQHGTNRPRTKGLLNFDFTEHLSCLVVLSSIFVCAFTFVNDNSEFQVQLDKLNCTGTHFDNCPVCLAGTYADEESIWCGCCTNGTGRCQDVEKCLSCKAGFAQPKTGQNTCNKCPQGHSTKIEGARNCSGCRPGTFKSKASFELCEECTPGTNTSSPNSTSCGRCPIGYYQSDYGQAQCNICPQGSYCDEVGCVVCLGCPEGQEARKFGAKNCTECIPGTYKENKGRTLCRKCKPGWYNTAFGQRKCEQCPRNYFCPQTDRLPIPCTVGSYCPPGSTAMEWCSSPFFKVDQNDGCVPTVEFIALVASLSVVAIIVATLILLKIVRSSRSRPAMNAPKLEISERQPLTSTEESSAPIYAGL
ncbi:multiple epidermal growth factor-like domains protein 9 isoform X1 [Elysia marginata]|uniref:Multiple epidermal growth factor-like domains protein 9 isoform X1 n=1 Tax=Elysia marginata TaxID=1093978 RepID=A0AAV4I7H2_9GAST|nr:multiple epidermal growth factor-like domains protein 9 isoform X1 [Elysia marginata]